MARRLLKLVVYFLFLVLGLGLAMLNTGTVEFNYHYGAYEMPLSLAVGFAVVFGAALGLAVGLLRVLKLKREISRLSKERDQAAGDTNQLRTIPVQTNV
jgi:uncharacterized integral membrane protein